MEILDFVTGMNSTAFGNPEKPYADLSSARCAPSTLESIRTSSDTAATGQAALKFAPRTSTWISFYMENDFFVTYQSGWGNEKILRVVSEETVVLSMVATSSEVFTINLPGAGNIHTFSGLVNDTLYRFDIEFIMDDVNGVIRCYVDSVLVYEYLGDTKRTSATTYDKVQFGGHSGYSPNMWWSAMFASDEDSRGVIMVQNSITGNGAYEVDMGGGYEGISHVGAINDSSPVRCEQPGQTQTFTKSTLPASYSNYDVIAVGVSTRSASPIDSPMQTLAGVITDGTNILEIDRPATEYYSANKFVFHTAPDGGLWDIAKADAVEVGFKGKA